MDFILGCFHSIHMEKQKISNTGKKHVKYNKQKDNLTVHTDKRTDTNNGLYQCETDDLQRTDVKEPT